MLLHACRARGVLCNACLYSGGFAVGKKKLSLSLMILSRLWEKAKLKERKRMVTEKLAVKKAKAAN